MIAVRSATPADAAAIARINADGWRTNYVGLMPASRLARVAPQPDKWATAIERAPRPWHVSVAAKAETVLGFLTFLAQRDESLVARGYVGEITAFYVAPARQGHGIGRALFEVVRAEAEGDGWSGIGVWTLAGSAQSCGFYAAMGGHPIGDRIDLFDEVPVAGKGFGWRLAAFPHSNDEE